jgi:hypothetical protein
MALREIIIAERDLERQRYRHIGIDVPRDDAASFGGEDPEVAEGLEVRLVIEDRDGEEWVEGHDKGGDGEVGGAEGVGAACEEERTDCYMGHHVASIWGLTVISAAQGSKTAEDDEISRSCHYGSSAESKKILAVPYCVSGEFLVIICSWESADAHELVQVMYKEIPNMGVSRTSISKSNAEAQPSEDIVKWQLFA